MTQQPHRLPEKYYVRRRVAAVVIILVVVALIVWALTAWGRSAGNDEQPNETVSSAPPTPATPTVELDDETTAETETEPETETETESESEASSEPERSSENLADKTSCEIDDLRVVASTSKPTYGANEQPQMFMEVTNPTGADCELTLEDDTLRFEVYDMGSNRRIWSDTDCYPSVITGDVTFEPGQTRNYQAVWSRTGSAPGQCTDRQPVPAGAYVLYGVIGDNNSDATPFNLN
ncbi:hypothetical protein [Corynebacterium pilosum]|uniref:Putative secreted protein n=1 Tax=Corynebacterium pilosum TaxID=35756 RepID=A0A376CK37_9CORY|nr:hypothetical protein [Corynebacterium pilosum]STC68830.1 putative secreted protein [Corynebacterium pilosum]